MFRGLLAASLVLASTAPAIAEPHHAIYVEALGKGGLWGLGYDYMFARHFAAGTTASFYMLGGDRYLTLSPYIAAYPVMRDAHRWFVQLGPQLVHRTTPSPVPEWDGMSTSSFSVEASSGYEYRRGVLVRAYAMASVGERVAPGLGVSLGWSLWRILGVVLLAGCGLDMSAARPWISIDDIGGALVPKAAAVGTLRDRRQVPANPLRVVTYNVEYGPDPDGAAAAVLDTPALQTAGVILLQEIEDHSAEEGRSRAAEIADQLGFGFVYVPAREVPGGTHGLAILSAFPITDVEKMDLPESAHKTQHRIAIAATLDVGGTPVQLIDVHLDTKLGTAERIAQLSPVAMSAPDQVVFAGDLNTSWVEWLGGTVPVLSSARAADQGPVIDGYMRKQAFDAPTADCGPTEHMFGFEQRLDAIYTRGFATTYGGVEHVGPSDHWPLWIDVATQ